jgi:hypothetical protein
MKIVVQVDFRSNFAQFFIELEHFRTYLYRNSKFIIHVQDSFSKIVHFMRKATIENKAIAKWMLAKKRL